MSPRHAVTNVRGQYIWLGSFSVKLGTPFLCIHVVLLVLSLVDVLPLVRRLDYQRTRLTGSHRWEAAALRRVVRAV